MYSPKCYTCKKVITKDIEIFMKYDCVFCSFDCCNKYKLPKAIYPYYPCYFIPTTN